MRAITSNPSSAEGAGGILLNTRKRVTILLGVRIASLISHRHLLFIPFIGSF